MSKITFLKPNFSKHQSYDAMQPLAFAILKGLTPSNIQIELYDERIEEIPMELETDLIAMSVETFNAKRAYAISDHFRKKGIPIVMGGYHPTILPDETLAHSDSIVIGEPEKIWEKLCDDFFNGSLERVYEDKSSVDISKIRFDRSIFEGKKYLPISPVQFSRGCNQDCDFCCIKAFYEKGLRYRSVDEVVDEISDLKEKYFFFVDDNLFTNKRLLSELLEKLIPLNVKWACQASIDIASQDNILKLLEKSGCFTILVGLESLSSENLEQMNKKSNLKHNDYGRMIRKIKDHNIMVYGTFIVGYDNDTETSANELADFSIKNKLALANFNPLLPLPKTKLYQRLESQERLLYDEWWLNTNFSYGDTLFTPRNMTPYQLKESCLEARLKFNDIASMLKRGFDGSSNLRHLPTYLISNLVCRKEILNKQGMKLG